MFIRHNTHTIEMTKKFAKAAEKFGSDEYKSLQEAKRQKDFTILQTEPPFLLQHLDAAILCLLDSRGLLPRRETDEI